MIGTSLNNGPHTICIKCKIIVNFSRDDKIFISIIKSQMGTQVRYSLQDDA
jgi:hypothetical protein